MSVLTRPFTRLFTPTVGGFLYYPTAHGGGRLISAAEHGSLEADWARVMGLAGLAKLFGVSLVAAIAFAVVGAVLDLSHVLIEILPFVLMTVVFIRFWQPLAAARRLVATRPDIAPPRSRDELRRLGNDALDWPVMGIMLVLSGSFFVEGLTAETGHSTLRVVGGAVLLVLYLLVAVPKLRSRRRWRQA